ncbi:hypothetical protein E2C01_099023 [Portunus trituberculatus]|uniref:Uncharacterized protein n=1 Tax=Portunus trituberculatus TaxID=210409 RepID=A0A5B7K978_PORTR|nr:hypothetical protein [Portunus trituberculatus]
MDVQEAACAWVLHRRLKRRKRRERRHLIHPILQDRLTHGMFATLYPSLREHEAKFLNYFRMSVKSFDDLLGLIQEEISSTNKLCACYARKIP